MRVDPERSHSPSFRVSTARECGSEIAPSAILAADSASRGTSFDELSLRKSQRAAVLLGTFLLSGVAHAQNADSFYYSNEAALTAGAMVAVPADDGAAWYNPAGLGTLRRTRVNANGSVFGVRVRPIAAGLRSSFGGLSSAVDYGGTDFVATPTTASASFSLLPNLTLSGGLFHTGHDVRSAVGAEKVQGDGRTLSQKIDTLVHQRKMHMGGAYGVDVGHGLRLGGGMFLVYSVRDGALDYIVGLDDGRGRPDIIALSSSSGMTAWGLQPTQGLQWDASKRLHFGAVFRFPELRLHASGRAATTQIASGTDATVFALTDVKESSSRMRWSDPARLFMGVAYEPTERVRLAFDGDVAFALEQDTWGAAHDARVRFRAGVLLKPVDAFHFGFGAFVDPASESVLQANLGAIRVDYYGGTAGFILRTRLGPDTGPNAPVLTLSSAVRYSVGLGDARTALVVERGATVGTQTITVHDIMPYLGSSVAF